GKKDISVARLDRIVPSLEDVFIHLIAEVDRKQP
ncbi:MAG: hypothetical protein HW374_131, partial [Bacteroidetes bacterium]|nr:hypothetical protein [Bacteroidota bacterium]